jgi:hypothetical protein
VSAIEDELRRLRVNALFEKRKHFNAAGRMLRVYHRLQVTALLASADSLGALGEPRAHSDPEFDPGRRKNNGSSSPARRMPPQVGLSVSQTETTSSANCIPCASRRPSAGCRPKPKCS